MKENIYNLSLEELKSFFIDLNEKPFRADQLWNWIYVKGINNFENINNMSKALIEKISYLLH